MQEGSRLGPYEITSAIGVGGMGEVYRARDVRVDREVAIKILPKELAADPARLARFEQEARATASLNHPNLLTIHDVGKIGDRPYLVFELLEGQTLRETLGATSAGRITQGTEISGSRITLRKAIRFGVQLANGLAAAHDSGVVHRDLKPENIFITTDGRLKILDFGLAVTPSMFEPGFEEADTMHRMTDPGVVMGTVGYMSPEQVRGKEIDPRSDIFSFGVVLYEMLIGRRPFTGESAADVMSSILNEDPADLDRLPPGVRGIIERCLEKSSEERFRSAHDLGLALEAISGSSRSLPVPVVDDLSQEDVSFRRPLLWFGIPALVVAALAGFFIGRGTGTSGSTEPEPALRQLTYRSGSEWHPSLAPDAGSFLFVSDQAGNDDIWLQRSRGENAINLTADSAADDTHPAFSPDGQQIAFRSEREGGGIWVMGATGESARRLTDFGFNPAWSADGKTLVIAEEGVEDPSIRNSTSSLWRVDVVSGRSEKIETRMDAVQPACSPDGKWIAFWGLPEATGKRVIALVPFAGGDPLVAIDDEYFNWNPVWLPDSRALVFASDRGGAMNLWRVSIDPAVGRVVGEPRPVTTAGQWNGQASVASDSGSIAYVVSNQRSAIETIPFDPASGVAGNPSSVISTSRNIWSVHPSPAGEVIAFKSVDRHEDLFLAGKNGELIRRLTNDRFKDRWPSWSPSGDRLYFFSDRTGGYEIWSIRVDGSGLTRETYSAGEGPVYPEPSPDGRRMVVTYFTGGEMKNAVIDLEEAPSDRTPRFLPSIDGDRELMTPRWSPDGAWLGGSARTSEGTIEPGIWLLDAEAETYRQLADRGRLVAWLDARTILARVQDQFVAIDSSDGNQRSLGPAPSDIAEIAIAPDGRSLYGVVNEIETDVWMLDRAGGLN